jgi:hypothetical protein
MRDQVEREAVTEPNGGEVTHVARGKTPHASDSASPMMERSH